MNRQQIFEYYSNDFVAQQIFAASKDREVAGAFWDGSYDKRPNMLQYKADIIQMAKKGVSSFHLSVEHWKNAMALSAERGYDALRSGFDLILDIDSKLGVEESQLAARLICRLLEKYGIKNYGIKFSGRRGFHISLPWVMFPKTVDYKPAEGMYPLLPRIVASFIRKKIRKKLMSMLVQRKGAKQLMEMMDDVPERLSPYYFVEVEKNWGSRHMFRAPFSLNEKTWLVSTPISLGQLKSFDPAIADPKYVIAHSNIYEPFFKGEENEAQDLVSAALDWHASIRKETPQKKGKIEFRWEKRVSEEHFPPCIKNILSGLQDGRKRSIFTLVNFLRMMNWEWQDIESKIFEWNEKNRPPLPRSIILGQLRWSQRNARTTANCPPDGDMYYGDTVNVCRPDKICMKGTNKIMIKNPIVYPFRLLRPKKRTYRGYSCGVCNEEFKSMRALAVHKSRTHGGEE